ncbi:MAG: hypothetical protein Q7T55_01345 [Solirubrobacteraceae bacterium]|nr:hypothetical protein [Solirubrobacteraceae bacterium]
MPQRTPRSRRPRLLGIAALLATLASCFVAAAPASAGSYRIWSCNTPAGKPTSTEGWTPNVGAPYSATGDNCGKGAGLDMLFGFQDGVTYSGGLGVTWKFAAPPNTLVGPVSYVQNRNVTANGADLQATAGAGVYRGDFLFDGDHLMSLCRSNDCTGASEQRVAFDGGGRPTWGFDAGCYGPANDPNVHCAGSSSSPRAFNSAKAIAITLIDDSSPTASNPGGTLLDAGARSGVETLTFNTADAGGGVWTGEVKLGDKVVTPRTVIDANGGRCAEVDVEPQFGNEFGYPVPCKTSTVTANLSVPTTGVPNGTHLLTATVYDVAYNATTVVSRRITVDNGAAGEVGAGGPNGTGGNPASGDVVLTSKLNKAGKISTHYGGKIDVTGRVVDGAGAPITGAALDVYETPDTAGGAKAKVGAVTTDAQGGFTYRPRTRGSRILEFAYAERIGLATYKDVLAVPLSVSAGVSLKLSRKAAGRRQLVRFAGKVRVDPFPVKGVRVAIEVRTGKKRWQVAKNVRARKAGAFSWSYRFSNRGPYEFRARVLSSGDLAARPAASKVQRLRVR